MDIVSRTIPNELYKSVMAKFGDLPYKERGITITEELIITAIELLNSSEGKILPQNARNEVVDKTPYGLDKLIKLKLQTDTRTANIISDILEKKGIAKVTTIKNARTGRIIKATRLLDDFTWQVPSLEQMKECE